MIALGSGVEGENGLVLLQEIPRRARPAQQGLSTLGIGKIDRQAAMTTVEQRANRGGIGDGAGVHISDSMHPGMRGAQLADIGIVVGIDAVGLIADDERQFDIMRPSDRLIGGELA